VTGSTLREGHPGRQISTLLEPVTLRRLRLRNRLAVAPMTRVSATGHGHPTPRMLEYYRDFAEGGFGLIISEGIYTDKAFSQGYLHQPGLADEAQTAGWGEVTKAVHQGGGMMIAQLMHAGALSQGNPHRNHTIAPSAVVPKGKQLDFYRGSGPYSLPVAMQLQEIEGAVEGFARAALNAQQAGFDGVEIHGANGYLLDQFLTEGINLRTDAYGGDTGSRTRLTIEVVEAVRLAVDPDFLVGVRISQAKVNDFEHRWSGGEADASIVFQAVARAGADYVHTTEFQAWRPAFGTGRSLAAFAKDYSGLPVIANGSLHALGHASKMVAGGEADLVSIGRGALTHSDFPARVKSGQPIAEFDAAIFEPLADLASQDRHRQSLQIGGAGPRFS
jgi:2,4-dienoyl-CoA reductase-like NADH-dependent reductase (Old Yellow Enzyme family)